MALEVIDVLVTNYHQSGVAYDEVQLLSDGSVHLKTFLIDEADLVEDEEFWEFDDYGSR